MRMLLWLAVGLTPVYAQSWAPTRIVAITDYVPLARQARISGDVEVKCILDANGSVSRADAMSGHPLLRRQASENAVLWKFHRVKSEPPSDTITLKYRYRLEGEEQGREHTAFTVDLPNTIQIVSQGAQWNP